MTRTRHATHRFEYEVKVIGLSNQEFNSQTNRQKYTSIKYMLDKIQNGCTWLTLARPKKHHNNGTRLEICKVNRPGENRYTACVSLAKLDSTR